MSCRSRLSGILMPIKMESPISTRIPQLRAPVLHTPCIADEQRGQNADQPSDESMAIVRCWSRTSRTAKRPATDQDPEERDRPQAKDLKRAVLHVSSINLPRPRILILMTAEAVHRRNI